MSGEDAELEDKLIFVPIPRPHRCCRSGRKQTRMRSNAPLPAPPADLTQPGEAELPGLHPDASVRAGPDFQDPNEG